MSIQSTALLDKPVGEEAPGSPLLAVRDLTVEFQTRGGALKAVNDVSFSVSKGKILAILGESGSGKSMLLKTILGIQSRAGKVTGEVMMRDTNLLTLSPKARQETRGSWVSMIFQNPMTALDPVYTVEQQIVETILRHTTMTKAEARDRALELLKLVQIPSPEQRLRSYPFECSGGMRQRIVIAMALACNPSLLLADEPTTALDVTVQARVLDLIRDVQQKLDMGVILVTHDIAVAAEVADEVIVMYAGRIVEQGPIRTILRDPRHPYTRGLLGANVRPGQHERPVAIPGAPPNLAGLPACCTFAPRCTFAEQRCWQGVPSLDLIGASHTVRCVRAESSRSTRQESDLMEQAPLTPDFVQSYLRQMVQIEISLEEAAAIIPNIEANRAMLKALDKFELQEVRPASIYNPA